MYIILIVNEFNLLENATVTNGIRGSCDTFWLYVHAISTTVTKPVHSLIGQLDSLHWQ